MIASRKLNEMLSQNIERICSDLLPDGKRRGHEYVCASCFGGAGTSFSLNLTKFLWSDFADSEKGGDLISLFQARANGDKRKGMADVYQFLGLQQMPTKQPTYAKPTRKFVRPVVDWFELDGPVYSYLTKERGIPEDVLSKYEVMMHPTKFGSPAYVFLYKSQTGNTTYLAKYCGLERTEDGKKKITAQADGLQVLYGMQAIPANQSWIVIVTGEIDALSYAAQKIPAVSIPMGDKNSAWIENSWDFLSQFKTIYLSFDSDESAQSMVGPVAARLGVERCKSVTLPHKDANDCLLAGLQLGQFIKSARDICPAGFIKSQELMDGVWDELSKGPRSQQGIPFLGWEDSESVNFRIRPHEVTVYLGMEFSGKSTLLYQLAAYLAGIQKQKVCIASLEESPEAVLGIMMSQWLAMGLDPEEGLDRETFDELYKKTIGDNVFIYNDRTAEASMKNLLDFAEYCIKRYGVKHFFLDSATCTDLDLEDNTEANAFMKGIIKSCNNTEAHYHLVFHARKGNSDEYERSSIPKKRDIKGSVTIPALAQNIVSVWRNSLKQAILDNTRQTKHNPEDVKKWADSILAIRKNRVGGQVGEFDMFFNPATSRFRRVQDKRDAPYILDKPF